jgi:antitoxin (DNA-binding transcriptional repressor) of toxin-antitoxin stability system
LEVNLYEAKIWLSQLVARAMVGEAVILCKAGKPMVRLVRVESTPGRVLGSAAGTITRLLLVQAAAKGMTEVSEDQQLRA